MAEGIGTVAARFTSTGNATTRPVRLTGVAVVGSGSGGRITLKNKDTNGNVQFDLDTPGNNSFEQFKSFDIPFPDGIHIDTFSNIDAATLFWRTVD
jgi:hypothetical protein